MGFFQKIIDDFGLGQHKVDEEALYAQIALFKDDLKAQEGKYTNQDEAIQFRDKWADLYKEAKAARLGKKSPLWEERKQFTDTFDRLAEVLTGYNSAVIAAESKRCDALLSDIDGKNLDPQQRAVVLCNEKRMLVLAGAGSGKTLTIAGKVKYLCQEKGVSPEDILLIAFTGKFFVGCSNYPKCDYVVRDATVLTEQKVCPQCGGFLVRRRGQYGEFYGCTNYPRCSYTEQISVEKKTGN